LGNLGLGLGLRIKLTITPGYRFPRIRVLPQNGKKKLFENSTTDKNTAGGLHAVFRLTALTYWQALPASD